MKTKTRSSESTVLRALRQGEFTLSLRHVGFGLHLTWIYVCFYSAVLYAPWGGGIERTHVFYFHSLIFAVVVLLLTTLVASRYFPLIHRDTLLGLGVLAGFAGPLLEAISQGVALNSLLVSLLAASLTGVGAAWPLIMWGEYYSSIPIKRGGIYICLSYLFAVATYFLLTSMEARVALATAVLLPFLSGALLLLDREEVCDEIPAGTPAGRRRFPIPPKIVLGLVLYSGLWGLFRGLTRPGTGLYLMDGSGLALIGVGVMSLLLAGGLLLSSKDLDLGLTYRPVLPLMAAGFLLLPVLAEGHGVLAFAVIRAGHTLFEILVWILLADIAFRGRIAGARVFGWGKATMYGSILAGVLLARAIAPGEPLTPSQVNTLSLVTVYIMLTSTMFILNERGVSGSWAVSSVGRTGNTVEAFGCASGLTPREVEVLELLVRGRSLPYIQSNLHVSQGTAKTHVSSIYRKLSVCSRQELLDVVEQQGVTDTHSAGSTA
ncbi:MAG: helix-turn-helix transcriptional regulator [Coriobacteriia bacterium]|nr:helix-turn-helix transcriptional regulator [Coriobacteriia bacterium]